MTAGAAAPDPAWRLGCYDTLASTSDLLVGLADAGEPEGAAILAHRQTGARGSRGRGWTSPAGNLALSVLLRPAGPVAAAGQWALLSAVVLIEALRHHAPGAGLSLKWPNDVLLGTGKLGGILLDSATGPGDGFRWLVIGFGANLGAAPELTDRTAAGLDLDVAAADVAATVLARLDHWRRVAAQDGFEAIRRAWLDRAHPVGTPLRVRAGPIDVGGQFEGIADDGALLLRHGGRVGRFATGELLQAGGV